MKSLKIKFDDFEFFSAQCDVTVLKLFLAWPHKKIQNGQ